MNGNGEKQGSPGSLRINRGFFQPKKLLTNRHQLSLAAGVSYPTVFKYMDQSADDDIDIFSGRVLYALLVEGFGMSPAEVDNLRVGDIFEVGADSVE